MYSMVTEEPKREGLYETKEGSSIVACLHHQLLPSLQHGSYSDRTLTTVVTDRFTTVTLPVHGLLLYQ